MISNSCVKLQDDTQRLNEGVWTIPASQVYQVTFEPKRNPLNLLKVTFFLLPFFRGLSEIEKVRIEDQFH